METNPKDRLKKQERNCVWLVNKFLVNGAKSMTLSCMVNTTKFSLPTS